MCTFVDEKLNGEYKTGILSLTRRRKKECKNFKETDLICWWKYCSNFPNAVSLEYAKNRCERILASILRSFNCDFCPNTSPSPSPDCDA